MKWRQGRVPCSGQVHRMPFQVGHAAGLQRPLVGGAQHDPRCAPRFQGLLPARGAQAPTVAGLEPRKVEVRHRRREVVALLARTRAQTVWEPKSCGPVSQLPLRVKPVRGRSEQSSRGSPRTFLGVVGMAGISRSLCWTCRARRRRPEISWGRSRASSAPGASRRQRQSPRPRCFEFCRCRVRTSPPP